MRSIGRKRGKLEGARLAVGPQRSVPYADFRGIYVVAERCEDDGDGSNGPRCIAGDDLDALITEIQAAWIVDRVEIEDR